MEPLNFEPQFLKLNFLDYLYNNQLISWEQYEIILKLKEAFQKTVDFKTTAWINEFRTKGGRSINAVERYYINNYTYIKLKRVVSFNIENIENILFTDKPTQTLFNDMVDKKTKNYVYFYDFVELMCELVDKISECFIGNEYDFKINLLRNKIKKIGFNKAAKILEIDKRILSKICKGDKDCKLSTIEKVFKYFKI